MRLRFGLILFVGGMLVAACGGGGSGSGAYPPGARPSPVIASAAPGASPVATTVPLSLPASGGSNASPAIAAVPIPAPTGYTSTLTVPIASAPAGTTVAITSSSTLPASLPVLQSNSRTTKSVRIPQATSNFLPIFFDALVPSATITVAGNISVSQVFPAGILSASTSYYLAFYDSTQPTPEWQTIDGPITSSDGVTLTFGGTVKSFSLQANQLYGFAIFALANSTATPPPAPQTIAYFGQGTQIQEVTEAGVTATTLPIAADQVGLDDSGDVYAYVQGPTPAPSSTATIGPSTITEYAPGSTTAKATLTTDPNFYVMGVAGTGEVIAFGFGTSASGAPEDVTDVWNPGAIGSPSYTITEPGQVLFTLALHDGTLYAADFNADGTFQYDIFPPGSSKSTGSIKETIVPPAQQVNFAPNYAQVGPDGTLYVTEYNFDQGDPLAGLYIYPPNGGQETFVPTLSNANGAGPEGVDIDAAGNIYVAENNFGIDTTTYTFAGDTLNTVTVFAPLGKSVLRQITGQFDPVNLAVASDGTIFTEGSFLPGTTGYTGSYVIPAGSSTINTVSSNAAGSIVIYDGNRETTGIRRSQSVRAGKGSSSFSLRRQRMLQMMHR